MPTVPQMEHSILAKIAKQFGHKWVNVKNQIFVKSRISKFLRPAQRYGNFKLIRIIVKFKKPAKLLSSSLPVSPSRVLRAPGTSPYHLVPSTFRPRGLGLSNPTSFLRPALPMAPTTDDNARDKRSVPATFLRDFTLYLTTNYAILLKRCLNYTTLLTSGVFRIS